MNKINNFNDVSKNGIILYKSKYGSTEQFAHWLKEKTDFDLHKVGKYSGNLCDYNIIIIGGSIHAGRFSLHNFIKRNWVKMS